MKTLSCTSMGQEGCDFVAQAETEQEVIDLAMAHTTEAHPDKLEGADLEAMKKLMVSKMETI